MLIAVPKEMHPQEKRITLVPSSVEKIVKLDSEVLIETGMGSACGFSDEAYSNSGAKIIQDRQSLLSQGDMVLRLRKPPLEEVAQLKENAIHISFLDPFNEKELVQEFAKRRISAISMELIPRTTRAQKMDALSSQANLAGYVAVVIACERLNKIFPMMMTPSGTIAPARVFVIGAGVAGLQAIATAKRLGARVEAFDTREVVAEQVQSLGAKFVKIDLGETGQTKDGYAKELTPDQLARQQEGMAKICEQSDVVITTAQVFGRKAPVIVTKDIVRRMKPGSVIVDMAVESGGNVEGSRPGEDIDADGVHIIGLENLPGRVAVDASQMYSNNLWNFISEYWDKENKRFDLKTDDDIIQGCLLTHRGDIVNQKIKP